MSYSRWGANSVWYTFWCASDSKKRDDQLFDVCGVKTFTYAMLNESIDNCIESIKETVKQNNNKKNSKKLNLCGSGYTDKEYEELKGYMREFINDVREQYDTPSDKYRRGEITLDDAFIEEV